MGWEIIIGILVVFWIIGKLFGSKEDATSSSQFGPMEVKLVDSILDDDDPDSAAIKEIHVKGAFPVTRQMDGEFIVSVFDSTDPDDFEPVISLLDQFQEETTTVYQHIVDVGDIGPDVGLPEWTRIGVLIPDALQTAYKGDKQLTVIVRLVDQRSRPDITIGFSDDTDKILWLGEASFRHRFDEPGFSEAAENLVEARALSIKIAVAVGWADGSLVDREGELIKDWITKTIAIYDDDERDNLKHQYNSAFKEAYLQAEAGTLVLSNLSSRLKEIGTKKAKFDTLELALAVMVADGRIDSEEVAIIDNVAAAIGFPEDELRKMKEPVVLQLGSTAESSEIEVILGIDPNWSELEVRNHLRREYQKWNNRLNALEVSEERDNAQRMLDLIAKARDKVSKEQTM